MGAKLALLIATDTYQDSGLSKLEAPTADAEDLAQVLRDANIADFQTTILKNQPSHVVGREVGKFFQSCRRDDLAMLYFTGHGLKDDSGRLYLAMVDTERDNLAWTSVSANNIDDSLEECVSRQKVIVLDCCYSGAYPFGSRARATPVFMR